LTFDLNLVALSKLRFKESVMSLISDALKVALADEKLIKKQEAEIAALKGKIESLKSENEALSVKLAHVTSVSKAALKLAKTDAKSELDAVKAELKMVKAELKEAQKIPQKLLNDVKTEVGISPKKRGRPRKVDLAAPQSYQAKDYGVTAPDVQIASSSSHVVSAKGNNYEYV
jgi:hypothetical protein